MENQHRTQLQQDHIEWLLGIVDSDEEFESLLSELSRMTGETPAHIIERRCRENEYAT